MKYHFLLEDVRVSRGDVGTHLLMSRLGKIKPSKGATAIRESLTTENLQVGEV